MQGGLHTLQKVRRQYAKTITCTSWEVLQASGGRTEDTTAPSRMNLHSGASLAAVPAALAQSAPESTAHGPVSAAVDCLDGLHSLTGLPWWASLALTGLGLRLAVMPLTIQQIRSAAQNSPLLGQAASKLRGRQGMSQLERLKAILAEFKQLRADKRAMSPLWIVGVPLIQLPLFVTVVMAVRRMAFQPIEGLETGGIAWFTDLTLPAITINSWNALIPMGNYGIILPVAVTGLTLANIDQAFSNPPGRPGGASTSTLLASIKLFLEWLTIPLFVTALQLPQAVLVYWSTSSAIALAQARLLRNEGIRAILGVKNVQQVARSSTIEAASIGGEAEARSTASSITRLGNDVNGLLLQAAEWKAAGKDQAAVEALTQAVQHQPQHSRAWFALAQTFAGMKQWRLAEQAYHETVSFEEDKVVLSKAWLGIGIAAFQDKDSEAGLQALEKAKAIAASAIPSGPASIGQYRSGDPLLFTAGHLLRNAALSNLRLQAAEATELRTVLVRSLLSRASILRNRGKLQEAMDQLQEAERYGCDIAEMKASLLTKMGH